MALIFWGFGVWQEIGEHKIRGGFLLTEINWRVLRGEQLVSESLKCESNHNNLAASVFWQSTWVRTGTDWVRKKLLICQVWIGACGVTGETGRCHLKIKLHVTVNRLWRGDWKENLTRVFSLLLLHDNLQNLLLENICKIAVRRLHTWLLYFSGLHHLSRF